VLHLITYQRLEEYLNAFARGDFHLLILAGAGGLARSRSVRAVLEGKACWIEVLAAEADNPRARLAAELMASTTYESTTARVKAFVEQGADAGRLFSTTDASSAVAASYRSSKPAREARVELPSG
jgi:hypothetical protein